MISLRAYNQEIEQLIDNGLQDEAIAHCRHILSIYPKCIETYRNMGKSLLESKKFSDAQDIFSRVLTAFPDDFIAHAGLSIIFENQQDLDQAIWHMEQAFDVQPSNLAIQDELKRLFAKRDGEKPIKIRLTRGALVRMYARGELYQQAISEIYSILESDARRVDLEVILAKMFFLSGSKEEAIKVCDQIISRFPFCFEANQIVQQYRLDNQDPQGAEVFRSRLISLDPYYEFRENPFDDSEIPENKVELERISFSNESNTEPTIPVWIEGQKSQWSEPQSEKISWLKDVDTNQRLIPPDLSNSPAESLPSENNPIRQEYDLQKPQLPEWMVKAGWITSPGENLEPQQKVTESALPTDEVEGDQHLDRVTPGETIDSEYSSDLLSETDELSEKVIGTSTDPLNDLSSLFSELQNESNFGEENPNGSLEPVTVQETGAVELDTTQSTQDQMPDWLKTIGNDDGISESVDNEIPDWLKELQGMVEPVDNSKPIADQEQQLPAEKSEVLFAQASVPGSTPDNENSSDEIPTKINGSDSSTETNEPYHVENEAPAQTDTPDGDEPSNDDAIPNWVKSVLLEKPELQVHTDNDETTAQAIPPSTSGSTAPLFDSEPADRPVTADQGIISEQTNDELLDWLRSLKTADPEKPESVDVEIDTINSSLEMDETVNSPGEIINPEMNQEEIATIDKTDNELIDQALNPEDSISEIAISNSSEKKASQIPTDEIEISQSAESLDDLSVTSEPRSGFVLSQISEETHNHDDQQSRIESLSEMIAQKSYDALIDEIEGLVKQGHDFKMLIEKIMESSANARLDFLFWQSLGDIYAHQNLLKDALQSYRQAEMLLLKSLS